MSHLHLNISQIIILAIVQGLAELLPISSSAHVILAEKLMGLPATTPEMTFLLVMLHTGTMIAVIVYFWSRWKNQFAVSTERMKLIWMLVLATGATGVVGLALKHVIEKFFLHGREIEYLFGNVRLIAASLFVTGVVILVSSARRWKADPAQDRSTTASLVVGIIQGFCLPFRGFSRSGATISTGLMTGMTKSFSEEFSFLLAVVLTPPVIGREVLRLIHAHAATPAQLGSLFLPGLLGLIFSFGAGLLAMAWLSKWLEKGKWKYFGVYCLVFSFVILLFS